MYSYEIGRRRNDGLNKVCLLRSPPRRRPPRRQVPLSSKSKQLTHSQEDLLHGPVGKHTELVVVLHVERVAEGGVRVLLDGGVVLDDALDLDEGGVVLATLLWLNEHRLPVARRGLEAVPAPLLDLANEAHLAAHVPLHDVKVHPRGRLAAVHSALHLVACAARGLGHRRTSFYCSSRFPHAG